MLALARTLAVALLLVSALPNPAAARQAPPDAVERAKAFAERVLAPAVARGQTAVDAVASELLDCDERSPEILFAVGRVYANAGDPKLGDALLSRTLEAIADRSASAHAAVRSTLARVLLRAGDTRRAAMVVDAIDFAAISDEQLLVDAAGGAAEVYARSGDAEKAYRAYVLALSIAPVLAYERALQSAATAAGKTPEEATAAVWAARELRAKPAADLTLRTLDGEELSLASLRGKVVLLNFWFPACAPCRAEFPYLQQLYARHRDAGLEVVAVDTTSASEAARRFLAERKIAFRSLEGSQEVASSFGVAATPTSLLIGRNGKVYFRHAGFDGPAGVAQMEREIAELLPRHTSP
jgi:thiol-disulfide isomerase/thioredoxin